MSNEQLLIYLDILGYKVLEKNKLKKEEFIKRVDRIIDAVKKVLPISIKREHADSIIMSMDYSQFQKSLDKPMDILDLGSNQNNPFWIEFFVGLATMQLIGILHGHPFRGVITTDKLEKAHEDEKKIASPVIAINTDLMKKIEASSSKFKTESARLINAKYFEYNNQRQIIENKDATHIIDFTCVDPAVIRKMMKLPYLSINWVELVKQLKKDKIDAAAKAKWKWIRKFIAASRNSDFKKTIGFNQRIGLDYFNR